MVQCYFLPIFTALTVEKSKENLTLHYVGKIFINLLGYNLKCGGLHF